MRINVFVLFFILLLHHRNFKRKTIMRPIAMKCTQEQFDSIKDRITLPVNSITSFDDYEWLVNFDEGISNVERSDFFSNIWDQNPEIHETFDANIFLEACDIEVEKPTFQVYGIDEKKWFDIPDQQLYRIKPQFNSADYQKEIEYLQQKAKENGMNVIIKFEKI